MKQFKRFSTQFSLQQFLSIIYVKKTYIAFILSSSSLLLETQIEEIGDGEFSVEWTLLVFAWFECALQFKLLVDELLTFKLLFWKN